MVQRVNTYLAALLITIVGSGAALLIMHVAETSTYPVIEAGGTAALKEDLLK